MFHVDPEFEAHEAEYATIKAEILGEDDDEDEQQAEGGEGSDDEVMRCAGLLQVAGVVGVGKRV